jgi:hypothetical protein
MTADAGVVADDIGGIMKGRELHALFDALHHRFGDHDGAEKYSPPCTIRCLPRKFGDAGNHAVFLGKKGVQTILMASAWFFHFLFGV